MTDQAVQRVSLRIAEAADSLGIHPQTVAKLVRDGVLPKVPHLGNRVLIPVAALERFANGETP